MLRACRRVLVSKGRLVFDVVSVPESLADGDGLADDYGFVATAVPYVDLLAQAGFTDIGMADTTSSYQEVAGRWLAAAHDLESELRQAMGDEMYEEKVASRAAAYEQLKWGGIGRTRYWATA